jgi:hypothetical protein
MTFVAFHHELNLILECWNERPATFSGAANLYFRDIDPQTAANILIDDRMNSAADCPREIRTGF